MFTGGYMKTETIAEFLARGGKITVCPKGKVKGNKCKPRKAKDESASAEEVNFSVIPTNLKIALGIK
jgi:hypothetical protein